MMERHKREKSAHDERVTKAMKGNKDLVTECHNLQIEWLEKELSLFPESESLRALHSLKRCESDEYRAEQKAMFTNLEKLLERKARMLRVDLNE